MGGVVGTLTETAADALGLRVGIPVAGGTNDAFASYLGAGLLEPGDAYDPGGSAGGFGVYWHEPVEVAGRLRHPGATGRAVQRGSGDGGDRPRPRLVPRRDRRRRRHAPSGCWRRRPRRPRAPTALVFLPYLAGERSPIWDPTATGVFAGLTLSHGRGHLARAIIEASALAIRHVATPMLAAGVTVTAMRACGGPARSDAWNQVKADVTGFPVLVPDVLETAVLGSAILGAVAIGAQCRRSLGGRRDDAHRPSDRATARIRRHLRPPVRRLHRAVSGGRAGDAAARRGDPPPTTPTTPTRTTRTRPTRVAAR